MNRNALPAFDPARHPKHLVWGLIAALAGVPTFGCGARHSSPRSPEPQRAAAPAADLFALPEPLGPNTWHVLGPFPLELDADGHRIGLKRDFLEPLGGEAHAALGAGAAIDLGGETRTVAAVSPSEGGVVDFTRLFASPTEQRLAYAYADIESPVAQTAYAYFGSDDSARVWLNGSLVHEVIGDRGVDPEGDRFPLDLEAGANRLLVKVDNGMGGWGFALRVFDAAGRDQLKLASQRRHLDALMPEPAEDRYLLEGDFPELHPQQWAARAVFGDAEPVVRWFGPSAEPVERPGPLGRYAAVVEIPSLEGDLHRRILAFAKVAPIDFRGWPMPQLGDGSHPVGADGLLGLSAAQRAEAARQIWARGVAGLSRGEASAVARARLWELGETSAGEQGADSAWLRGSEVQGAEHRLAVRLAAEGRQVRPLRAPRPEPGAPALGEGGESDAGVKAGSRNEIRRLAQQWAQEDPNGFVVLAARKGVVFFHEGFNGFEPSTKFRPASLGKTIFGLLFARAVDQGLLDLDQPVGDVLPDFRKGKLAAITFRNLFNHVAGLRGHASHGGLFNTYLDNALALQDAQYAEPRQRFFYNGDDLNLAAKALELTVGQSAFRLLYENMQAPFDPSAQQLDMGFGQAFSALYLARVGQMVLQDGAYAGRRYYSPGFLQKLWPRPISESVEGFEADTEWGIGMEWMIDPEGPREENALGPHVIGHGAASGSVWRIAPDHDLVLVVGRSGYAGAWGDNERRIDRFVVGVAEALGLRGAPPGSKS